MQPLTNVSILSMESVDQVGRRERFMQSNFESLSGGDEGVGRLDQLQVRIWGAGRLERRGGEVAQRHAGDVRSVEL